ncbi:MULTISPECIES: hypothetical protein [Deinococcus]|uniref:Restriction endonuclease domain-containing protein n=1 Tax=Deinococcus rufus TaxID=2136097 RepID=A0ABV7Z5N7_9DEIO|nr:hypothetical protein [Deinococcus sp. AB2017081]WQE95134.1 hypothetical protein U2P90_17375 [Deinococcus sp. AB2017081]
MSLSSWKNGSIRRRWSDAVIRTTALIVEQHSRRVYAYRHHGQDWKLSDLEGTGEVDLPCLGRRLTLDEIYRGVL